jgi:hypothetical protein
LPLIPQIEKWTSDINGRSGSRPTLHPAQREPARKQKQSKHGTGGQEMATEKRLIYLDDLLKFPIRINHYDKENGNEHFVFGIESVLEYAEHLPTVDAVEVVRCKDCKHRGDAEECPMRYFETERSYDADGHMMLDYFDHDYTKDDGFCDRGERREAE